jgi:Ser/Thr protein kinase RdoA (MazF antagonist)
VLLGADGKPVQPVDDGAGGRRLVSMFHWIDGEPFDHGGRIDLWEQLGALMATVHERGAAWHQPPWFTRRSWDVEAIVGDSPTWGDPLTLGSWTARETERLRSVRDVLRERLGAFGRGPDRFGLVHADLSFENLLLAHGRPVLIDFDDCGFSWYLWELAVALFPYDGEACFDERRDALVRGYRSVAALSDQDLAELPTFVMARRYATLGWTFSHAETAHARRQRSWRLRTLASACERYLAWAASEPEPKEDLAAT